MFLDWVDLGTFYVPLSLSYLPNRVSMGILGSDQLSPHFFTPNSWKKSKSTTVRRAFFSFLNLSSQETLE